ncbi:MAG TPA: 2,3-bisphosphoglycerate-independent phosphoglycerate mutase [Candidatus Methylomirabilis sp.]|nr:2,3-bisphosphoglycerate-independent phosphoglycerate mutase [Candidatus Methylomirabilis sp.]
MGADLARELAIPAETKLVLLVLDGLGGLPREAGGPTELEAAAKPTLDRLAAEGVTGLLTLVAPGVTPGSGPGHLALFGYDPLTHRIGRGILEALGIDLPVTPQDVAARGNFCTVDAAGRVTDRRAGRVNDATCRTLSALLDTITVDGAEVTVRPVREHRFVVLFRGEGLSDAVSETDPQQVGQVPLKAEPLTPEAAKSARVVNAFVEKARAALRDHHPANMVLLRGFARHPALPTFRERFGLRAAAIAIYPMYRGLARLAGMEILPTGTTIADQLATLRERWGDFDFFFIHFKRTDTAGEDGDFAAKVGAIEEVDRTLPALLALRPDVLAVTGDHSTPAALRAHSWHPVPVLLWAKTCRPDTVATFGERPCTGGGLGHLPGRELLPLMLAHAGRLTKFGA